MILFLFQDYCLRLHSKTAREHKKFAVPETAFGIDRSLLIGRVVFVTDRGANIVAALRGYTRLNCNAHILNIILSSAFAPDVLAKTPELSELLTSAKKMVMYFKHSGQQNSLKTSLDQSIETRWNMMDSIMQQYEEISTLLMANNQYDKILQIIENSRCVFQVI